MTINQLKESLYAFKALQVQSKLLQDLIYSETALAIEPEYKNQLIQWKIIAGSLTVLSEKERFIIETHIIGQITWGETAQLFDNQWAKEDVRSERTLMRIQHRALQKMTEFINRFENP